MTENCIHLLYERIISPLQQRVITAIREQNLEELKVLLAQDIDISDIRDQRGDSVLHIALNTKNIEILDYLLNFKEIDVNGCDSFGHGSMSKAATFPTPEILRLLIKNGADVNLCDPQGDTPLHQAITYSRKRNCLLLLENGASIYENSVDSNVLYNVCRSNAQVELLAMLIFHGGEPHLMSESWFTTFELCLIRNNVGFLNFLIPFVFEGNRKIPMRLEALVSAMHYSNDLFYFVIENLSVVLFDQSGLEDFIFNVLYCDSKLVKVFFEKFDYVLQGVQTMQDFVIDRYMLSGQCRDHVIPNLSLIYSEPYHHYFVDIINKNHSEFILAAEEDLDKILLQALSFGMLLCMDIEITSKEVFQHNFAEIIYDVHMKETEWIPRMINWVRKYDDAKKIAEFFNIFKYLSLLKDADVLERFRKVPQVPSLLELSRNVVRNYIPKYYDVKNSAGFYAVLQEMPISGVYKDIIGLKSKIYCLN